MTIVALSGTTVVCLLVFVAPLRSAGQQVDPDKPAAPAPTPADRPRTTNGSSDMPRASARSWSGLVRYGAAYDGNIDQNQENNRALGVIVGAGLQYLDDPADPSVSVTYETGVHRYSGTDRWNRVSHHARAHLTQDLPWRWSADLIGEISLKGTTEERELSNQFNVIPRLNVRLTKRNRLRVMAAWRERRYDDTARNATNRYVGSELSRRREDGGEWKVEARYERNHAVSDRHDWDRVSVGCGSALVLGRRTRVEVDVKYRFVRFVSRTVEIDNQAVLRRDHRWTPTVVWRQGLSARTEVRLGYTRESRDSNDARRDFGAHQVLLGVTRRF